MRLTSKGDTIVEVLLAIAIVSSVLTSAFVAANRAYRGTRMSQERMEALKLAETQVELLKSLAGAKDSTLFDDSKGAPYCIADDGSLKKLSASGLPVLDADNFAAYPPECNSNLYYFSVQYDESDDTFSVRARWDGLDSQKQEVALLYRAYERAIPAPPAAAGGPDCANPQIPVSITGGSVGDTLGPSHLYAGGPVTYEMPLDGLLSSFQPGCQALIVARTYDPARPPAVRNQLNERLFIRFYLEGRPRSEFVETELTGDLPASVTLSDWWDLGIHKFPARPSSVEFRHYSLHPEGAGDSNPNSIEPYDLVFWPVPGP